MLVLRHDAERGIIITSRGVGASVAANRVPGIRAAACHDAYSAAVGAKAEGMNVLVLALHALEQDRAQEVVDAYLGATLAPSRRSAACRLAVCSACFPTFARTLPSELAVAELAKVVGMSQYYFSKLFKLSTGTTPHQYVMRQRVERAQEFCARAGPHWPGCHPRGFRNPEPLYQRVSPARRGHPQALSRDPPGSRTDGHVGTGVEPAAEVSASSLAGCKFHPVNTERPS